METLKNIDQINNLISTNDMVLLYVSSESCGVCKVIFPKLMDMLRYFPEMKAGRIDIDELPLISGEYNIFTIPCVLVFVEGKEIIREARYINVEAIDDKISRYYGMIY